MSQSKRDYFQFIHTQTKLTHWWQDPLFITALIIAIAAHLAFISIQFVAGNAAPMATKDVTIAVHLNKNDEKIKDSDFVAQHDQAGDGELKELHAQTSPIPNATPAASEGKQQQEMLQQLSQKQQLDFQERMLMTTLSWQKQSQEDERKKKVDELQSQQQSRAAMVASIEAQYAQRHQMYAKKQKVKTITGIQAKADASAEYLDRFRQKVEMFGNRYYPEAAKQQKLSGEVRLMVILNAQGGIRAIRLLQSSGSSVLDEAAKASVRRAMPFGKFDTKMKDISELRIVRTWRFDAQDSVFDVH
ncbi:protein TonB [Acinetobacter marinus]|uniref:Protein TonB n=1 Tax=Acinetobacter marinus TaxID=281375 RepID=A0A1G6ND23_9GAMM|nr:energy transducer TonB [Acinetobacter marinus]SDC65749.1 protein TonB [Acinetobacter marinus]